MATTKKLNTKKARKATTTRGRALGTIVTKAKKAASKNAITSYRKRKVA